MDLFRQFGNSTIVPSPADFFLALPRLAHRAGSFLIGSDYLSDLSGYTGSVIADRTSANMGNVPSASMMSDSQSMPTAVNSTASLFGADSEFRQIFTLQNIRNFGGILSYLLSKWVLATLVIALVLNRAQFFASSRRPIALKWRARVTIYVVPISIFIWQTVRILQTLRCQTSPDWSITQYRNHTLSLPFDYAGEGGLLHQMSSAALFWETEKESCATLGMLPAQGEKLRAYGSTSRLWPLFWSLGVSQFVATIVSALQGRQPSPETGMTIFEHSLAFSEAETAITRPNGWLSPRSTQTNLPKASTVAAAAAGPTIRITQATLLKIANVPLEVLVISLISSLSHLSSNILAAADLRTRYRLINTSIWGLCYMGILMWSFARAISSVDEHVADLRYPLVCIMGFIPHLLILIGIAICAVIYGFALLLTAISLPLDAEDDRSLRSRLSIAHQNLQANVHLRSATGITINWQEDFYTVLLKVGFTVLTAASEAVFLNEKDPIAIHPLTWLEEERIQELIAQRQGLKRILETVPAHIKDASLAATTSTSDKASLSGYGRERKTKREKAAADGNAPADREVGVGFVQRRNRFTMSGQLTRGIFWLQVGFLAKFTLALLSALRIPYQPKWLTDLVGRGERSNRKGLTQKRTTRYAQMASGNPSLDIDIEAELRRGLDITQAADPTALERDIDQQLYESWARRGWWGNTDSSGDFSMSAEDDDITSVISTTESVADWTDDEGEADGQRTPTRSRPWSFDREATPVDDLFQTQQLATLLDPQTPEQREEARMLAAHLASDQVLTRSRHRKMIQQRRTGILTSLAQFPRGQSPKDEEQLLEHFLLERRKARDAFRAEATGETGSWASGAAGMGSGGPQCVVCQSSPRTILSWPCGCLSVCDDCRIGLATRNFSACVCCRSNVQACSRLYVP